MYEFITYCLSQVNKVNWPRYCFHRIVTLSVSLRTANRSITNANSSKIVIAMDFKFDTCSQRQSGYDSWWVCGKGA